MTTTKTIREILSRYAVTLTGRGSDRVTDRAVTRDEARALVRELVADGYEASDAPDNDDRTVSWVYVDESQT